MGRRGTSVILKREGPSERRKEGKIGNTIGDGGEEN